MIMTMFTIMLVIILISFSFVLLFGAPYLPTLKPQIKQIFKAAKIKPGDKIIDLGCGDGRVLIYAAKQGIYSVGYELNPILVIICWFRSIKYRKYIQIVWGDFFRSSWPDTDVVFAFLLNRYMDKLNNKCVHYSYKPVKLVSFAFKISSKQPSYCKNGIYIYKYK